MKPEMIIDAYNLIYRVKELREFLSSSLEDAREHLLIKLMAFKSRRAARISVVFDGDRVHQQSVQERSGIKIYYSVPPQKADEVIKILLQRSKNPQNITVVSSDNEVMAFARRCRANTVRSEDFFSRYLVIEDKFDTEESSPSMSKEELQQWLKLFGKAND